MKRVRVAPFSAKRLASNRERKAKRERFLGEHSWCAAMLSGCTLHATDVHEVVNRSQLPGAELIEELYLPLCRPCHSWITDHPLWAKNHGFSVSVYLYQQAPEATLQVLEEMREKGCRDQKCTLHIHKEEA